MLESRFGIIPVSSLKCSNDTANVSCIHNVNVTLMKMDNLLDFKGVKGLHFIHGNIRNMYNKFNLDSNITSLGLSET